MKWGRNTGPDSDSLEPVGNKDLRYLFYAIGSHQKSVNRFVYESFLSLSLLIKMYWRHFGGWIKEGQTRDRNKWEAFSRAMEM